MYRHELHHRFAKEARVEKAEELRRQGRLVPERTLDEYLEEEIDSRVVHTEFGLKIEGYKPYPGYVKGGKVDREFIDKEIKGSQHYNPQSRKRIGRTYDGAVDGGLRIWNWSKKLPCEC